MKTPSDPLPLPAFLEARRQSLPYDLGFANRRGSFADWRDTLLAHWRAELPPHTRPATGSTTGEAVTLRFATGAVAAGVFLCPPGPGPHPALLVLHDHGGDFTRGWAKLTGAAASARHYDGTAPLSDLCAAGFAVLCLDALGWGGRQAGGYEGQQALAANALHLGWSIAGLVAAEDAQAAAWLATRPEVDAARIGAWGFSWGGFRAWQVAALSPHVRAAVAVSWMARRAGLMLPGSPFLRGHSAFWMLHPGLGGRADFPDMAGLAAGKPLFLRSGHTDLHMPVAAVQDAYNDLTTICAMAGAPAPDCGFFDGGHTYPAAVQAEAQAFLTVALA